MKVLGILIEPLTFQSMNATKTGVIWFLRAAWIAGTLPILVASRINSFLALLLGFAKRGKIMSSSSHKYTVPQSFFLHFYLLAVVWTTMLLMGTRYFAYKVAPLSSKSLSYPAAASHLTVEVVNFAADQVAEFNVKGQDMLSITDFDLGGYVKPITRLGWCCYICLGMAPSILLSCNSYADLLAFNQGSLRERRDRTAEYVIPHGDWFEIVSSPYYLS